MPTNENTGYLVQLQSPEGDNLYPIISAEMIKDAEGNTYDLSSMKESVDGMGSTYATKTELSSVSSTVSELSSDVQECFQSVSEGKSAIASAITGKGISTAADATFQTMANNISNISSIGYGNFNIRLLEQHMVSDSNSPYTFSTTLNPESLYLVTGGYFNLDGVGTGYYIALIYNNTKLPQGFSTVGQFYYDNLRVSNNKLLVTGGSDNKAFDLIQVW